MGVDKIRAFLGSKALLSAFCCVWSLLFAGLAVPAPVATDPLADVQLLRQSGCGGVVRAAAPLRHIDLLDDAAAQWAFGRSPIVAAQRAGYPTKRLASLHITAVDAARLQRLRQTSCPTLLNRDLTDVGVYRRGRDVWLILASASIAPANTAPANTAPADPVPANRARTNAARANAAPVNTAPVNTRPSAFGARVLQLVNEIRARGTSCGGRAFAPSNPVRLSTVLEQVAYGHALDMAQHQYFEHQDLTGHTPADRVRAVGYREKLVGENIAYGPKSPDEVVRGWLDSPGHCENIMDPRFAEMGVAAARGYAPEPATSLGLYWVQVFADPKI
jgi:uncharacterized protein YkwD